MPRFSRAYIARKVSATPGVTIMSGYLCAKGRNSTIRNEKMNVQFWIDPGNPRMCPPHLAVTIMAKSETGTLWYKFSGGKKNGLSSLRIVKP